MKTFLAGLIVLFLFASPGYADQHSNEPEEAPNEVEIDEADENSKGNDVLGNDVFCKYSKAC